MKRGPVDLINTDSQHAPLNERELFNLCAMAEQLGVGVRLRIKHLRQAYLLGNYADLGPLAMVVPLVEDEQTVRAAIEAFYYPPFG